MLKETQSMTRGKVLIVEDDRDICEVLTELANCEGYLVDSAADGAQGLASLQNGARPDLILVDAQMPVLSGLQFIAGVRASERLRTIPMILMSASKPRSLGQADGFLPKPMDIDLVCELFKKYCPLAAHTELA